jgi:glycosyltransferase involved in cell wall biosynthesis
MMPMPRSLRVLELTEAFTGGVFTSLTRLASGLAARGHEVHLAYSRRGETHQDIAAYLHPAVRTHELSLVRSIDPRADLKGFLAVRRLIRELEPDVLHFHSSKAGVLGRIAAFTTGDAARVFYSPRGLAFLQEDASPRARALFRRIEWACARLGGTVVACSASEEALVREHLRPRGLALIENAVDIESVAPRVDRDDGLVRIGIVGRITYARNPPLFAELARRHASSTTRFLWVGGGEERDARMLRDAGVEVSGWQSRPDALAMMSRLDIYLHPSRWEGMPVALIEAQIAGLPAVATDVVGNRDVIREGETGFLRRDASGLSEALGRLIADPALRLRLGARARELATKRFALDRMIDEYERLYATAAMRAVGGASAR